MTLAYKILRYTAAIIALLLVLVLSIGTIFSYIAFKGDTNFLQIKQAAVATGIYLPFFYCHIFGSAVILIIGFFQFTKLVYKNRPLHRTIGKIYVLGILFFASPGAYIMTFFVGRGTGVFISFMLQNTLWFIATLMAWRFAINRKFTHHVCMMRRSYALAFGAVMLRFYIYVLNAIGIGVNFPNNYLIIAFASWVPNLILAEVLNYYDKGRVQLK